MQESLDGIGPVQYRRNSRAKRVIIRMKPHEPVLVTVPPLVPIYFARKAVLKKADWIHKQRRKMDEEYGTAKKFLPGTHYNIKNWTVRFEWAEKGGRTVLRGKDKSFRLLFDPASDPDHPDTQATARRALEKIMKLWMKQYVVPRIHERGREFNIPLNRVTIKRTTSQWGSFSTNNNMSLSLFLATVPDHLIEYVVMHELAHFKEPNHSPSFWKHLATMLDEPIKKDREMRKFVLGKF